MAVNGHCNPGIGKHFRWAILTRTENKILPLCIRPLTGKKQTQLVRFLAVVKTNLSKSDRQLVKDFYNGKAAVAKLAHLLQEVKG